MRRTPAVLILVAVLAASLAQAQPAGRVASWSPPRLALVDGQASFWRPGVSEWTAARVNTPLGTGDALFTAAGTGVEIQIGPAAYLRLGPATYVELSDVSPELFQVKLAGGDAALDLRELAVPRALEVNTPQAAFTIDRPGYYRVHVDERGAAIIVRRAGAALATPSDAGTSTVRTGEEAVVTSDRVVHRFKAPDLDGWDRFNAERTDHLMDAPSTRYVPDGVYGLADLDRAGTWRESDEFGAVWIPESVGPGWVPFGAGDWTYDSTYGWTWVDAAAWGWAPFHHGRWVQVDGRWAWAPGPPDVVPAYAPATVGWLEGGPGVGWVPLGWGEPIFPWWGPPGVAGVASWTGWGGTWVVNGTPIQQRMTIYPSSMSYTNTKVPGGVVTTRSDRFVRPTGEYVRASPDELALMRPRESGTGPKPVAASLAPTTARATKPPSSLAERRVVATRVPPDAGARVRDLGIKVPGTAPMQLVLPPPRTPPPTGDRPPEAVASSSLARPPREGTGDSLNSQLARVPRFSDPPGVGGGVATPPEVSPPPLAVAAAPRAEPPPIVTTSTSTASTILPTSSTLLVTSTSMVVTSTSLVPSTTLVATAGEGGFLGCTDAGAACGPCAPSGEMSTCSREIGSTSFICTAPRSCRFAKCVVDGCGAGERCVRNPVTQQANCCAACAAAERGVPPLAALPPTTSSTLLTTTTVPPATSSTIRTTTSTMRPTPTTLAAAGEEFGFQRCKSPGAACGPCPPSGEMSVCFREIGYTSSICMQPGSCRPSSCLWDSDCGLGQHCVQNAATQQTNCCQECTGAAPEEAPATTSSTMHVTTTSIRRATTSTTLAPTGGELTFQSCMSPGAACGPCAGSGKMGVCLKQIGNETAICLQPETCVAATCLWDRECGEGQRCVLNNRTLRTNCCTECTVLIRRELGPRPVPTTTTLPRPTRVTPGCIAAGERCGPCAPSGLMAMCQERIGTDGFLCPKPGTCVEASCNRDADCLVNQRCILNGITERSNCCEVCE